MCKQTLHTFAHRTKALTHPKHAGSDDENHQGFGLVFRPDQRCANEDEDACADDTAFVADAASDIFPRPRQNCQGGREDKVIKYPHSPLQVRVMAVIDWRLIHMLGGFWVFLTS